MLHNITDEEWLLVCKLRGQKQTGLPHHTEVIDGVTVHYFWSWGMQPDDAVLRKIGASCPVDAAARFLASYEPASTALNGPPRPRRDHARELLSAKPASPRTCLSCGIKVLPGDDLACGH